MDLIWTSATAQLCRNKTLNQKIKRPIKMKQIKTTAEEGLDSAYCSPDSLPDGYLPDFEGKPVLASCRHCQWCSDVSDGWEYGSPWYVCEKEGRENVSNLKSFPFNTPQKCCELDMVFVVDWNEEAKKIGISLG